MPAKKATPKKSNTDPAKVTNKDLRKAVTGWRRDASPTFRNLLDAEPVKPKPTKKGK